MPAPNPNSSRVQTVYYSVTATFPDEATAVEYTDWLTDGHVQQVLQAGASAARIVRLDPEEAEPGGRDSARVGSPRLETHYEFPSRAAFDRYVREFAPALRADGLKRFPATRGVRFERRVGQMVGQW